MLTNKVLKSQTKKEERKYINEIHSINRRNEKNYLTFNQGKKAYYKVLQPNFFFNDELEMGNFLNLIKLASINNN